MKLGLNNPNLYVGVPTKYFNEDGHVGVKYNGNVRRIYLKNKVKGCGKTFNDQFSDGTYTIEYFKWRTRTNKPLEPQGATNDEYKSTISNFIDVAEKAGVTAETLRNATIKTNISKGKVNKESNSGDGEGDKQQGDGGDSKNLCACGANQTLEGNIVCGDCL